MLPRLHCLRCHYTWIPRTDGVPVRCPSCCSTRWNQEYRHFAYVTDKVLASMRQCPLTLCQRRYEYFAVKLGKLSPKAAADSAPAKRARLKLRQVRHHEIMEGIR